MWNGAQDISGSGTFKISENLIKPFLQLTVLMWPYGESYKRFTIVNYDSRVVIYNSSVCEKFLFSKTVDLHVEQSCK